MQPIWITTIYLKSTLQAASCDVGSGCLPSRGQLWEAFKEGRHTKLRPYIEDIGPTNKETVQFFEFKN